MLHLNINQQVTVELTELGLEHLKKTKDWEIESYVNGMTYRTQLWCLIANFPQPYMAGPIYYSHSVSFEDTAVTKSVPVGRDVEVERACTVFLNNWFGSDSAHQLRVSTTYENEKFPGYKTIFNDGLPIIIYKKNAAFDKPYRVAYFCCETEKEVCRRDMTLKQIQDKLRRRGNSIRKSCDKAEALRKKC